MKGIILLAVFLSSTTTFAQSVDVKVSGQADIKVHHYGISKGGVTCRGGSNGTYKNYTETYKAESSAQLTNGQTLSLGVNSNIIKRSIDMFKINVNAKVENTAQSTKVTVSLNEVETPKFGTSWSSGCDNNHYYEYLKNAGYQVDANISYKVPEGVWAVDIEESEYGTSVFSVNNVAYDGHIQGTVFNTFLPGATKKVSRRIWVKPGTVITKSFNGHDKPLITPNTNNTQHTYWVKFTPVGKSLSAQDMNKDWLIGYVDQIEEIITGKNTDLIKPSIETGASILRSRVEFEKAIKTLPTNDLDNLSRRLFNIATNKINLADAEQENSLRIISALAAYELGSALIEELSPYCTEREVNLPYTMPNGKTTKVLGLAYATFLMERMKARINISILDRYADFVSVFNDLQKKNMTYEGIFSATVNQGGKEVELKYILRQSYDLLQETASPEERPFAEALQDLDDFYSVFRSVGTGEDNTNTVINAMLELVYLEDDFIILLSEHIESYTPGNQALINVDEINQLLNKMREQVAYVSKLADGSMRFTSIAQSDSLNGFTTLINYVKNHNFAIISKPYEVHEFDFNFEKIRKAYHDAERTETNITTIDRCVKSE